MHHHGDNARSDQVELPQDLYPKKTPKPGAKAVRWADQTGSRPLEQVREFEIIPNERGLSRWVDLLVDQNYFSLITITYLLKLIARPVFCFSICEKLTKLSKINFNQIPCRI